MHFLCYSYCANEQPPDGAQKKSSVLYFHIHLIKWTVHEESFFSCCFSSSMSCVFLPEERWRGRTVVFWCFHRLLKQCVCADIAVTDYSQVESHMSMTTSQDSHRRDRQYKISVKKQTHTWIWGRLGALRACLCLDTY